MTQEAKIMIGIGLFSLIILITAVFLLGRNNPPSTQQTNTTIDTKLLVREDSNKLGTDSAKVVLVEFGDFQCPSCAAVHPIVKQIVSEQKDVLFVFRNFPLPMHQNARKAAEAAEAALSQGKYWEMHSLIFENQGEWSNSSDPTALFVSYAKKLGLEESIFAEALKNNAAAKKILGNA